MGYSVKDLSLKNGNLPIIRNFVYSVYVSFYSFVPFLNMFS